MIGLLHGVNPVPRLAVPVTRSGELRVGVENWVTVAGLSLVLPQAPEGAIVVVKNCTTSAQVVSASSQITGVTSTGAAIPATNRVRISPGQVGSFLRGDRGWIAQGCEPMIAIDPFAANLEVALPLSDAGGLVDRAPEIRVASGLPPVAAKTITSFGSPSITNTRSRFYGASLSLNGTTQYLSTGSLSVPADFCVEGWVWIDSTQTSGYVAALGAFEVDISSTQVRLSVFGVQSNVLVANYAANQWFHIAFYRSSGVSRLAVNGVVSTAYSNSSAISGTFTLGQRSLAASSFFRGSLQDWRVYLGVAKYGASNFTPPGAIYL